MSNTPIEALKDWNKTNDRHAKLQHVYGVGAIVILIVAGIIGLVDYDLGQKLFSVSLLFAAIFFANAVAWALIDSFLISRLTRRPTKK